MLNLFTRQGRLYLFVLLGLSRPAWSQQDKMFSQYMFNMLAINPAYAGSREVLSMSALYRNQWTGVQGAPQTATFTLDMPLNQERIGLGLQLYGDRVGVFEEAGAFASYAFRFRVGARSTLALGVQGGASSYRGNLAQVQTTPGNAGAPDPNFSSNISRVLPNFGTGLYLSSDRGYVSVSVPRLIRNKLSEYNVGGVGTVQVRQGYLGAGFVVGLSPVVKLKPSMLLRYAEGSNVGYDGNVNVWFADRLAVGVSVRRNQFSSWSTYTTDAVVGLLELQLSDEFRFGYAYDRTLNGFRDVAPSSHEFMIRYEFGVSKSRILHPRYL